MIEMNTVSALERTQALVLPQQVADTQATSPTSNPATPVSRQGEAVPGVQVEISAAAREVAARDALPEAQNATAPANTPAESSAARPDASETGAQTGTALQTEERTSTAAQARAMQMFNETAGLGLEQANNSTLRESV